MPVNLYLLKASNNLVNLENTILNSFNECVASVENKINLPDVDVVVDDDSNSVIPETGVGGYSPNAHIVYVHVDLKSKDISNRIDFELKSTLAHELHHCARSSKIGYGKTLLEAIVSEGLADHFDIEINKGNPKPWSVALNESEIINILEKAKLEFYNESYDHSAWFFGSETKNIPRWAGYSIGFYLVQKYMDSFKKKASELVEEKADLFI